MVELAVNLYVEIIENAVPFALVFGFGNLIVNTFLTAAFGGSLKIGGGR